MLAVGLASLGGCADVPDELSAMPSGGDTAAETAGRERDDRGTVRGSAADHYFTDSGWIRVPTDISGLPIAAIVTIDGQERVIPGTGTADGYYSIRGVPENATYTLDVGHTLFLVTDARRTDVGGRYVGRPDAQFATTPGTQLTFRVPGPVDPTGLFEVISASAGAFGFPDNPTFQIVPDAADPSLTDITQDWAFADFPALVDAGRDDVFVVELGALTSSAGVPYFGATRAFDARYTQADGQATTVDAAFDELRLTSYHLDWRRSAFERHRDPVHPGAASVFQTLALDPIAGFPLLSFSPPPDILFVFPDPGGDDLDLGIVRFGNPYPREWSRTLLAIHFFEVDYALPDGTTRALFPHYSGWVAADGKPVRPLVSPPRALRVDGQDAAGPEELSVGPRPTLRWRAPEVGTADAYELQVRWFPVGGGQRLVAEIHTSATSARIPDGVLQCGERYAFKLGAWAQPNDDPSAAPFIYRVPSVHFDAVTSLVHVARCVPARAPR